MSSSSGPELPAAAGRRLHSLTSETGRTRGEDAHRCAWGGRRRAVEEAHGHGAMDVRVVGRGVARREEGWLMAYSLQRECVVGDGRNRRRHKAASQGLARGERRS